MGCGVTQHTPCHGRWTPTCYGGWHSSGGWEEQNKEWAGIWPRTKRFAVSLVASGEVFQLLLLIFYVRQDVPCVSSSWPGRDIQISGWWSKPVWQRGFTALSLCALLLQTHKDDSLGKCSLSLTGSDKNTASVYVPCSLSLCPWIGWALVDAEGLQLAYAGFGCLPSMPFSRPVPSPSQPPRVRDMWYKSISLFSCRPLMNWRWPNTPSRCGGFPCTWWLCFGFLELVPSEKCFLNVLSCLFCFPGGQQTLESS